ncbi:zinc-binding alcohol dehydrogenase family protein [Gordonia sp. N1V]|uniref:quinone oxidoreductase family protein n=1 Tax=Gordonia sp. N1V TaxID=3034163 RepID=UPI0023E2A3B2|nr:zinc-binding alcohol dehydrogenase family protein [Gordonia sp. N1V]MDF3283681.1 zinc-binding alcohol dehydrogenase family protein [Gordonia sp. N1V]
MKAALVTDLTRPPVYADLDTPVATDGYVEVQMLAAGVHQIVRSIAGGAHYSSGDELPFVVGVDGVAILGGHRVYTGGCPDPYGTIAERTVVPAGFAVPIPDALSSETAAAVVNPAMSSWMPLVKSGVPQGGTVAVLGATGTAGTLAVRIALHLGAGRVVAVGRNAAVLARLAEDSRVQTVSLLDDDPRGRLAAAFAEGIDVILDYLWGPVAEMTLEALRAHSLTGRHSSVDYVQIGALAGRSITLDAAILRARPISIWGSGGGSIDPRLLFAELPALLDLAAAGGLPIDVRTAALADVEQAWNSPEPGRLVVTIGTRG